jgi:hypothetical protein
MWDVATCLVGLGVGITFEKLNAPWWLSFIAILAAVSVVITGQQLVWRHRRKTRDTPTE